MLFKWNYANWVSSAPFSGRASLSSSNTRYLSTARMMRKFPPPKKPMNNASLVTLIKSDHTNENEKWVRRLFVLFFPGQFIKDLFSLHKKTLSLVRVQIASTGMYLVWKRIIWTTVHLCVKQCKPLFKHCWSLFLTILLLLTQI